MIKIRLHAEQFFKKDSCFYVKKNRKYKVGKLITFTLIGSSDQYTREITRITPFASQLLLELIELPIDEQVAKMVEDK